MSRYKCWKCETEHETDNVVAVCIQCFDVACRRLAEAEARTERWRGADRASVRAMQTQAERAEKAEAALKEAEAKLADSLVTVEGHRIDPQALGNVLDQILARSKKAESDAAALREERDHWKQSAKMHSESATKWHGDAAALRAKVMHQKEALRRVRHDTLPTQWQGAMAMLERCWGIADKALAADAAPAPKPEPDGSEGKP